MNIFRSVNYTVEFPQLSREMSLKDEGAMYLLDGELARWFRVVCKDGRLLRLEQVHTEGL